jgi:dipeptidyl aminopeptidase/acylaminoacyl peptidase
VFGLRGSRTAASNERGGTRRWLGVLGVVVAGVLGLEAAARWSIALAIALAPNALGAAPAAALSLPPELARRGATRLETRVGPAGATPEITIASWLIEPQRAPARGTIVLLHGVRQDRRSLSALGAALSDAGYRSLLVDLRGHGESSGRYLTYGSVDPGDISAVLDDVAARGHALGRVGAFGFSYGAAVALDLGARDERVCAVVAAAPFASLREVLVDYRKKYLPAALNALPERWFESALQAAARLAAFDLQAASPLHWVQQSRARQLLIHGTADTQVPLRHSVALSSLAGPLAELRSVPGAEHYDLPAELLEREALTWFERWLAQPGCGR